MIVYRLKPRVSPDGVVYLHLGYGWRLFFILVTVVLISVMIHDGEMRGLMPFLAAISLFASVYYESWRFDPHADEVVSKIGIWFFARSRRFRLSSLRRIKVRVRAPFDPDVTLRGRESSTGRGAPVPGRRSLRSYATQRGYVQLILEFVQDERDDSLVPGDVEETECETLLVQRPVVQTESLKNRDAVQNLANELGRLLRVPAERSFG